MTIYSSCKIYFKKLWNIIIFQNYFIIYKLFLSWIIKKSKLLLLEHYCCLFLCWTICFQTSCAQKYQVIPNHSACLQKTAIATDSGKVCLSVCLSLLLSFSLSVNLLCVYTDISRKHKEIKNCNSYKLCWLSSKKINVDSSYLQVFLMRTKM